MDFSWSPIPPLFERYLQGHAFVPPFTKWSLVTSIPSLVRDQMKEHHQLLKAIFAVTAIVITMLLMAWWRNYISTATSTSLTFAIAIGGRVLFYIGALVYAFDLYKKNLVP